MAKKWPFIVVYVLILAGLIAGSFCDLSISRALYQSRNGFGAFLASIGEFACYGGISFLGGIMLAVELLGHKLLWRKILLIALEASVTVFRIDYQGKAIISRDAYDVEKMW